MTSARNTMTKISRYWTYWLCVREELSQRRVMTPKEFSVFEKMLGSPSPFTAPLRVGVDYDRAIMNSHEAAVSTSIPGAIAAGIFVIVFYFTQSVDELFKNCQYLVTARSHNENPRFVEVCLLLKEHASKEDLLHGMMVAHWCRSLLAEESSTSSPPVNAGEHSSFTAACPVDDSSQLHQQSLLCFIQSLRSSLANHWRSVRVSMEDRKGSMNFRLDVIEQAIAHTDHTGRRCHIISDV